MTIRLAEIADALVAETLQKNLFSQHMVKKDAIVKAMNIVSAKCIFTEWDEEFLENANNLSLQELREYLHGMDIGGGAAFIYWIVEVETDESVFESGYEEDDDDWVENSMLVAKMNTLMMKNIGMTVM